MEFLNPAALYGLLALPLLFIPYLIRKQPRRMIFSSLLLFANASTSASSRPWGRLRLPPIFFLQLLLLTLLILALGEPVFSVHPSYIAIILDNSASMQTVQADKSRFSSAKERARELLSDLPVTGKVDLYRTVPRLERIRGEALNPAGSLAVLSGIEPYDLGDTPVDYSNVLNRMAREQGYDRVYLITDHSARNQGGSVRVITVGEPQRNLALTSFQISPASLVNSRLRATVEIGNFSSKNESVKILLRGRGTLLGSRDVAVAAGKTASASFEGFPLYPYYEAEIDTRDGLLLDNRRFAVPPKSRNLRILGVSPRSQALASLRTIPGVTLDIVAPDDYQTKDKSGYDLEIFQFAFPSVLPKNPALFVLPPANNLLADLKEPISHPVVSSWREPHVLTRYVNFSLFRPSYARPLKPRAAGETIIDSSNGPLAVATDRDRTRYLVLGFDPLPYLGRANLPISIFTLNFLDWFFETSGSRGTGTGAPLEFAAAQAGDRMVTPKAEKIPLNAGVRSFSGTFTQGIYQLNRKGESELFAVNLDDSNESDLRNPSTIEIRTDSNSPGAGSTLFSFWPYLVLASLVLLMIEWFIPGRTRPPMRGPASTSAGLASQR